MKKLSVLALSMVLTATLFAGCRRSRPMETTRPTVASTTQATTAPATQATHPGTEATMPSETIDRGNDPAESTGGMVDPANGADGTVDQNSSENSTVEGRKITPTPKTR